MTAPNKILIPSDSNEMTLVRTLKDKEISYEYQFTKSLTKEGLIMTISEDQLNKNLKQKIFINGQE
jgi:hypothetical protein